MPEDKLTQKKAGILKAMAHPTRLNILESLRAGERCVCEIIELVDTEQSNTSQHLAQLKKMGIISSRKDGLRVIYKVNNSEIFSLFDMLDKIITGQMEEDIAILKDLKRKQADGQSSL